MRGTIRKFQPRLHALRKSKLSIVLPIFNQNPNIAANLQLLMKEVEEYFPEFEIITVSDGSTDGTDVSLLSFKHPNVIPIIYAQNQGKGKAIRSGFEKATGQFLLFIDGGMEIHPREIRIFMGLMDIYECDIVVGSKRHPQSKVRYPLYRRMLSWIYQVIVRYLFQVDVTDTQVGIKLFRREVIDAILPYLEINRYGFDLEMLCLAHRAGFTQILEAPIRLDYFGREKRFLITDLYHVFKVGISLMKDTLQLYRKLEKIKQKKESTEE